jgi:hypothetical protein
LGGGGGGGGGVGQKVISRPLAPVLCSQPNAKSSNKL